MESNFEAMYKPGSVYSNPSPSSSGYSYFTKQAIECYNGSNPCNQFLGSQEAMIEREMEKQRILQEILAEEAAMRRRELEAEVRRELMVEQWRQHSHRHVQIRSFEERIGLLRHEKLHDYRVLGHRKIRGYEDLPLAEVSKSLREGSHSYSVLGHHKIGGCQRLQLEIASRLPPLSKHSEGKNDELPSQPKKTEAAKSPSKVMDEDKIIFLGKSDTNHSGIKRKGEWSCDLCDITATSEMGLKDHLTGKKHKIKQAKVGRKAGKIGLALEMVSNPLKPSQVSEKAVSDLCNVVADTSQQISSRNGAKMECEGWLQKKRLQKKKFWCEICEIRAFSEKVMKDHVKGKRHLSRLNQLGTKYEDVSAQAAEKTGTN